MMVTEELLHQLGVQVSSGSSAREINGFCPVHHLVKGRGQDKPKWYINRFTGAWLCFSCQQRGSLFTLVQMLGGDEEMLQEARAGAIKEAVERWSEEDEEPEEPKAPEPYISEYGFNKHRYPHKAVRQRRDILKTACIEYNLRWDEEGRCFLIPLYRAKDGVLIGWQKKSKGFFSNEPDGVDKSLCLFGYQQFTRGAMIFVESPLDVVRLASHGIRGAVATMGSYVSDEQLEAALNVTDEFVLAFDNDEGGEIARKSVTKRVRRQQLARVRYFVYPGPAKEFGKDPGELAIEHVHAGLEAASSFARAVS